jgi:hypothetical protein
MVCSSSALLKKGGAPIHAGKRRPLMRNPLNHNEKTLQRFLPKPYCSLFPENTGRWSAAATDQLNIGPKERESMF